MPFFSVITCTFNSEDFLAESIASVESQVFLDYEHIFVDAFSTDATLAIIEAYRTRCPNRVVLLQLPANGISDAMNAGVALARGEVILHLHSDDELNSEHVLCSVRKRFAETKAAIVIGNCKLIGRESISYTWAKGNVMHILKKVFFRPFMFYSNLIPHPSAYVRKSVFEKHGCFDKRYKVVMDYDFWFRVLRHEVVFLMNEVLSVYRFHPNTVSTTQMAKGLDEIDLIRKHYRGNYPVSYAIFALFLKPLLVLRRLLKARSSSHLSTSGPV